ncbi:hypothetical protein TSAR_007906 [Trichomalopsis sarcophagae]|uniref:Uncharacterized protein n=1 Tax=Trichomalopsis sarcophagae TaxID=543379 RepID=A0A232FMJ3_9HYME|nr:hypothetical protein TSAR_007906 [Trichomalopsis sarcophagae]
MEFFADLAFATRLLQSHKASIAEQASNAVQTNMVPQASNACHVNNLIPLQLFEEQTGQLHCLLYSSEDHDRASTVKDELEMSPMLECEVPSTKEGKEESTPSGSKGSISL